MGFCLLNNIAIAAAHARRALGAERVFVVDWDVHHGNGTQNIFYDDPGVLFASLHQWPFYPGTGDVGEMGKGEGEGHTINIPLSHGAGSAAYLDAFDRVLLPICDRYRPDLVLVSAGFDAHRDDPLAEMELDAYNFGSFARRLLETVGSDTPVGFFLEGGYDLHGLRDSVHEVALAAAGEESSGLGTRELHPDSHAPGQVLTDRHHEEVHHVVTAQKHYWRL